ncbi:C45 family autoproteolytic acyltransferase/hydolase [Haloechinothrix halophila]|uniref:C45 family autoproteolytic acyltransferase/hydolase n=1 Tax=Haloechinothrix halophila TaxID=1069073 RepID=UPI00054FBEF0|nr:C45 family peptidase [Haloechinothrix halophila]
MSEVTHLTLSGSAYARGLQHGRALSGRLRAFLDDSLARIGQLRDRAVSLDELREDIAAHRAVAAEALPDVAAEVRGLAAGAAISFDEAWLLQLRREILGYSRVTAGDCTTYAATRDGPVLAQTVDLNGNLDDYVAVLSVSGPRYRSLVLSFGGLLGYLGVNEGGVGVGLNLVLGGTWRAGVPPYLAIRHVLDVSDSVDHALEVLRELPLASSRAIMLCDRQQVACVEIIDGAHRVLRGPELVHTNHFLHPEFAERDELNVFARNSSVRRLEAVHAHGIPDPTDAGAHYRLLSQPPLCVPDTGDIRRERTVAAVLMRPDQGELLLWPGNPAMSAGHSWHLG